MAHAFNWRAQIVWDKLCGRTKCIDWPLLLREVLRRHAPGHWEVVVESVDDDCGIVQLRIGERDFWFPEGIDHGNAATIFDEVYNPRNGHHYDHGGSRIEPGDVVLDAGAAEGFFVRFALERGASVIAVEADARLCECLHRTFASEIRSERVEVVSTAIGDRNGFCRFRRLGTFCGKIEHAENGSDSVQQKMTTIDSLVQSSRFGRLDFIKMDIEGAERLALEGARKSIEMFRPKVSITTYHNGEDCEVLAGLLRGFVPEYRMVTKGVTDEDHDGTWRPTMLHAYCDRSNRPAGAVVRETPQVSVVSPVVVEHC